MLTALIRNEEKHQGITSRYKKVVRSLNNINLSAGVGGLSLVAAQSSFSVRLAVEDDKRAVRNLSECRANLAFRIEAPSLNGRRPFDIRVEFGLHTVRPVRKGRPLQLACHSHREKLRVECS